MGSQSLHPPPRSAAEHVATREGARVLVTAQPSPAPALQRRLLLCVPSRSLALQSWRGRGAPSARSSGLSWRPRPCAHARSSGGVSARVLAFCFFLLIHRRSLCLTSVTALCRERPARPPGQALPAASSTAACGRLTTPSARNPLAFLSRGRPRISSSGRLAAPPDARRPVRPPRRCSAVPPRLPSHPLCHARFDGSNTSLTKPAPPELSQVSSFVHSCSSSALSPRVPHSCSSISSSYSELQTGKQPPV